MFFFIVRECHSNILHSKLKWIAVSYIFNWRGVPILFIFNIIMDVVTSKFTILLFIFNLFHLWLEKWEYVTQKKKKKQVNRNRPRDDRFRISRQRLLNSYYYYVQGFMGK